MSKWQPEEKVQINFRATLSLRDWLEIKAAERHFNSVQELILDILRTYKDSEIQTIQETNLAVSK